MFLHQINCILKNKLVNINILCTHLRSQLIHNGTQPLLLKLSGVNYAEPLKKKKAINPSILKAREEKKKKKLEKEILKMEKLSKQKKPIEEMEVKLHLLKDDIRKRPPVTITDSDSDERYHIKKDWSLLKHHEHMKDISNFKTVIASRERALKELRVESEDLYREAIQLDMYLIPFRSKGPTETPHIKVYIPPDGDYNDTTPNFE